MGSRPFFTNLWSLSKVWVCLKVYKIIGRRIPTTGAGVAQTKAEEQFISIRVTEDARTWTAEQWDDEARRHALYACEMQCVKHTHTHTHMSCLCDRGNSCARIVQHVMSIWKNSPTSLHIIEDASFCVAWWRMYLVTNYEIGTPLSVLKTFNGRS